MSQDFQIKIFAIEDDSAYTKFLQYVFSLNPDFEVKFFKEGKEAVNHLHENPSIITLDYTLPDTTGEYVLKQIKEFNKDIPVIIISGQKEIGTAVTLLKLGAFDYITKDEETKDRLLYAIKNARQNVNLINEISNLKQEISTKYDFNSIIGSSPQLKRVFALMEKAVKNKIIISISGETGTGKEVVAKGIHYNSNRKKQNFVAVNITAIPKDLIESELFGHEKGAFTGADTRRIGKFEDANHGTVFLDEIGDMDPSMQSKLLRVLQEKELSRIGSNEIIRLDVRIIVATHKDLAEEVRKGNFREDLYYRLLGLPILIPPLRERGNDIILLAKHFLKEFAKENEISANNISNESKEKLLKYSFPGNVRELKSIIELAAVMSEGEEIIPEDISFGSIRNEKNLMMEEMTLKDYTFKIISYFLEKNNDDVLAVADKLDIGKSSIYRYLQEMKEK